MKAKTVPKSENLKKPAKKSMKSKMQNGSSKLSKVTKSKKSKSATINNVKKSKHLTNGNDKLPPPLSEKSSNNLGWADETLELPVTKPNKKRKMKQEAAMKSKKQSELNDSVPVEKSTKSKKNGLKKPKSKNQIEIHQQQIESLKDIDPEFYSFLKKNDKELLDFNWDDTTDDDDDEDADFANEEGDRKEPKNEKLHIPKEKLEVASDESDFEESDSDNDDDNDNATPLDDSNTITLKQLKVWESELQSTKVSIETIRCVTQAFSSALASISDQPTKMAAYKVTGGTTFNAIIQLCVLHLQQAVHKFLGVTDKTKIAIHKTKKWEKVRGCMRSYFLDLTRLIEHVSSTHILTVLLKHLHQISIMAGSFPTISKPMLKRLIVLWSTSEESVRVLSFLCILKMARNQQQSLLTHVLKAMYMSYVRNSKFVSPTTLPGINFMRRSLVEMFALDLNVAYQHAFLYIRQLAIHLRNAIILKKKDSFQSVYNWQFVNSIRLWTDLLGSTANKPQLQPLIYPLVSITTGVIKLIPTAQFFPLRFHCIQALISLARQTNTFIPVLPFILEVLNSTTFNKKHTIVSMKPMQFTCILRLNKSQMAENGFRDEVVENVCGLTLEHLAHESASLAFPDFVVPTVMGLKQYLKVCKNANYSRKIKQILDKIMENSKLIESERNKITFGLRDVQLIQSWEAGVRNKGTPLGIYYASWLKTHEVKKKRQAANTDDINDYNIPMIKRKKPSDSKKSQNDDGDSDVELFPSDSEDDQINFNNKDDEMTEEVKEKPDRKKKTKKSKISEPQPVVPADDDDDFNDDEVDIVKDLDLDDW